MSRPAGVTVSAVFLILVSLFVALMGAILIFAQSFLPQSAPQVPYARAMMTVMNLFFLACAAWGLATAWGLFRMWPWARISVLVIGALLMMFCSLSQVMLFAVSQFVPEMQTSPQAAAVKAMFVAIYTIPILMGLWWVIYFSRAGVRAKFLKGAPVSEAPKRPLSIAVIAWHAVVLGLLMVPFASSQFPAMIFGFILTGWAAKLTYFVFGGAQLTIGIGLLKLKRWGHTAAVWFCIYALVHSVVFFLLPDKTQLLAKMTESYASELQIDPSVMSASMFWFGGVFTWLTIGTVLWFLFTRKQAFLDAGRNPKAAD